MVLASSFASKRKKRRIVPKQRAADKEWKKAATGLFFDAVPESVNEHILRWLSDSPRDKNWVSYISNENVVLVMELQCDLGALARSRFDALCVGNLQSFDCNLKDEEEMVKMSWVSNTSTALDLLAISGKRLTSLIIDERAGKKLFSWDVLDRISELSPNVTSLLIRSAYRAWLERFGARLVKLSLGDMTRAAAVATAVNCINLKELYVSSVTGTGIKKIEFWPKMTNLEKLSIEFLFSCSGEIKKITSYCRKLKSIHIAEEANISVALTDCFVSYGEQLEYAFLPDMKKLQLRKIVEACPNGKFSVLVEEGNPVSTLSVIGSRMQKLELRMYDPFPVTMLSSWNSCTNVKSLQFTETMDEKLIGMVFSSPKLFLEHIEIRIGDVCHEADVKKCLDLIADGSGALQNLVLSCTLSAFGAFEKLVEKNPGIRYVSLKDNAEDSDKLIIVDTVETLLKASLLRDLFISNYRTEEKYYEGVKNICASMRMRLRSCSVTVAEYDYLT